MQKDYNLKARKNNVFNLLKDMQSLTLEDGNPNSGSGIDRVYNDMGSMGEDTFVRSVSNEYFRSSSIGESMNQSNHKNYFDDDYFLETKRKLTSKNSYIPNDFTILSTIGSGAYSSVLKVKYKKTGEIFAVKLLDKKFMKKEKKLYQVFVENELLNMCNHPNIIKIFGAYEDSERFYLVLENSTKGSLAQFINTYAPLNEDVIKFFLAQTLNAIEYLSNINIVHRDIKPDNVVIDKGYKLKLIDFSTATLIGKVYDEDEGTFLDEKVVLEKLEELKKKEEELKKEKETLKQHQDNSLDKVREQEDNISGGSFGLSEDEDEDLEDKVGSLYLKKLKEFKNQNFVGTPEYMAPEVINCKEIGVYTDLWSFGCLIYQCFTGVSPFADKTQYLVFQNILNLKYKMDARIPKDAQDLITCLLRIDPKDRLGSGLSENNTIEKLKKHHFFDNFDIKQYLKILEFYIQKTDPKDQIFEKSIITSLSEKRFETKFEDKILKVGELKKKSPWLYYDKRKIVLYTTPRIDYLDPQSNILRGSIPLNKESYAELKDKQTFDLITPNRKYTFKCKSKYDITPWVTAINDAIKNYSK